MAALLRLALVVVIHINLENFWNMIRMFIIQALPHMYVLSGQKPGAVINIISQIHEAIAYIEADRPGHLGNLSAAV